MFIDSMPGSLLCSDSIRTGATAAGILNICQAVDCTALHHLDER